MPSLSHDDFLFRVISVYAIKRYLSSEMILNKDDLPNNILIGCCKEGREGEEIFFYGSNYLSDVMRAINVENLASSLPIITSNNNNPITTAVDFYRFRKRIVSSFIELEQKEWPPELVVAVNNKDAYSHIVVYMINSQTNKLSVGKFRLLKESILKIAKMKDGEGEEKDWNDWTRE